MSRFTLHAGEILGIAGVIGSGREDLTRTLAGFAPHTAGRLTIAGRDVTLQTPADAVDLGIGYVPSERRVEGLVLFLPVSANITLADLASLTRYGLIDGKEERRVAPNLGRPAGDSDARHPCRSASTFRAATSRRSFWPNG